MAKAKAAGEVRHGPPDTHWTYNDAHLGAVEFISDGGGVVELTSDPERLPHEQRIAADLGLTDPNAPAPEPQVEAPEEPTPQEPEA